MPGLIWAQRRSVQMLDLFHNEKLPIHDVFKKLFINSKKQQEELSFLFKNFSFQHAVHALRLMVDTEFYVRIFPNDLKLVKLQLLILNFGNENIHKSFLKALSIPSALRVFVKVSKFIVASFDAVSPLECKSSALFRPIPLMERSSDCKLDF